MELLNGCHVLVCTPAALMKVLDYWPDKVTDFKRLVTLVLDDADVLLDEHSTAVNKKFLCCDLNILII
jgi:superfamily II DNA/RNA helicase